MPGIYIHIPFCKQACHYCDFHFSTSLGKKEAMVSALCRELELRKDEFRDEVVETIYFGGGTPSVLSVNQIDSILNAVYTHYTVDNDPEVTLEANPDDLSVEKLHELNASAINRLSIGIQSFFEADLVLMNRAHNAVEAEDCIHRALRYFSNISLDLIYGIPGMGQERWKRNVEKALAFNIPHISSYALTVEPKTALASFIDKGLITAVSDEVAEAHFHILLEMMEKAGFQCYEISNFGKPGFFSKNNTAYWQQKKYMGIGPSAHSYDGMRRGWNINNNPKYLKAIARDELPMEVETLSTKDRYNEYVMTGLRTMWGVSYEKVRESFGQNYLDYLQQQASRHLETHLLFGDGDRLLTTRKGRFLADGIAADLFLVNL